MPTRSRLKTAPMILFFTAGAALSACGGGGGGSSVVPDSAPNAASISLATAAPIPGTSPLAGATALPSAGATATPATRATAAASASATATPSPIPTVTATVTGGEMPRSSDAFTDSAGVNVHLNYGASIYGSNFPLIASRLTALGVRHIRDGTAIGQLNVCAGLQQLAASGIHLDMIVTEVFSHADFLTYAACIAPALESTEGPNEYDIAGHANWQTTLDTNQPLLYAETKALGAIAVVAPSMTSEGAYGSVGSLTGSADYGNMHDYFAGHNPGSIGWGPIDSFGEYGSLPWNIGVAAQDMPGHPMIATESGYSDGAGDTYAVPAATKARYMMRMLLEHWNAGVVRTYFYELADEGGSPFAHYGMLDSSGGTKPAYTALRNLLGHTNDAGATTSLTPLNYTIVAASSVHHVLLQKRSGAYVLALWNEVAEWDPNAAVPVTNTAQPVTLTFAAVPSSFATTTFDDNGNVTTAARTPATSIGLSISGSPTLVDIAR